MKRTFRFALKPNAAQGRTLERWLGVCCDVYNAALQERRDAWARARVSRSYFDQTAELTAIRAADPDYAVMPLEPLRSAVRRVDLAFKAFFRRCKRGETPGYPRFRSKRRYDSFAIGRVLPQLDGGKHFVRVPKLGLVRFRPHREMRGQVLDVAICRDTRRWYVCFSCDMGEAPPKRVVRKAVGIDLGLTDFVVLSDGTAIPNGRFFRHGHRKLARWQRVLARRARRSRSRERARVQVARAHEHVRAQRRDFHRKLAADLCARYDLIAHEDLSIRGLSRSMLAKSVSDVAWGQFIATLQSKAEEAGVHVVAVDPRNTTQACSRCGAIVTKSLRQRTHACPCGFVSSRDHNAALNVLALGLSAAPSADHS